MSRRQLHEGKRAVTCRVLLAARTCGMEARGQAQHRTQVKLRKAGLTWVSEQTITTPDIQLRQVGTGDGGGAKRFIFTLGDLPGPGMTETLRLRGVVMGPWQKSDHLVVVPKPGNAGGAKGVMD